MIYEYRLLSIQMNCCHAKSLCDGGLVEKCRQVLHNDHEHKQLCSATKAVFIILVSVTPARWDVTKCLSSTLLVE